MSDFSHDYQIHRYKNGHQLVTSTVELDRVDQDTVDRLSDISGSIHPGEQFNPYFTCYPLPSGKYFTIARTWQDLLASRAGCVFTVSVFVPMTKWEEELNVSQYFLELLRYQPNNIGAGDNQRYLSDYLLEGVENPVVMELVEALFLEQRKPIVVFNSTDSDKIIYRLYSGLWRNIRRNFATCSFALSPRSINNRQFDLVFAPIRVKAKFSEWDGRKIDGNSIQHTAKHRWTTDLVEKLFISNNPKSLQTGFLNQVNFEINDEAGLRLTLLWKELIDKSEFSPTAILGLLDIANSQPALSTNLVLSVQPVVYRAVYNARNSLKVQEVWQFYNTLLGKYNKKIIDVDLVKIIKRVCTELASESPAESILFFENYSGSQKVPNTLYSSLGSGLAGILTKDRFKSFEVSQNLMLHLTSYSEKFAELISKYSEDDKIVNLDEWFQIGNSPLLNRAVRNLARFITNANQAPLLESLLIRLENSLFAKISHSVIRHTKLNVQELNLAISSAAIRTDNQLAVLGMIALNMQEESKVGQQSKVYDITITLLNSNLSLIDWFLTEGGFTAICKHDILWALLEAMNLSTLKKMLVDSNLTYKILKTLGYDSEGPNDIFANVVLVSPLSIDEKLKIYFDNIIHWHSLDDKSKNSIIVTAIVDANQSSYPLLMRLIQETVSLDIDRIFENSVRGDSDRILRNLKMLLNLPALRPKICKYADIVSHTIVKNSRTLIDIEFLSEWLKLIAETSQQKDVQFRAAANMLEYAFRFPNYDVVSLLIVSFPIVYKPYKNKRPPTWFFPFSLFTDSDPGKPLRVELVNRFLNSRWPEYELFRIAFRANIVNEILFEIRNYKGYKKYVSRAIRSLENSNEYELKMVLERLLGIL